MSLMALSSCQRVLLLGLCAFFGQLAHALKVVGDDPDWNYDKNGADWTMGSCGTASLMQSPQSLTDDMVTMPWDALNDISFLPAWQPANITAADHGFSNYTYRINATDGNMGSIYLTEPFLSNLQILWNVTEIRFKYPAEHSINDEKFDLEMQIVLNDTLKRGGQCSAHRAALSIFFKEGDSQNEDFWSWVGSDEFTLDLSTLYPKTEPMESQMWGYQGTDSQPDCENGFCWYLNYPSMTIKSTTLAALKQDSVSSNNRARDLGAASSFTLNYAGYFYEAPSDEL